MSSKEILVMIYLIAALVILGFVIIWCFFATIITFIRGLIDGHRRRKEVKNG